MRSTSFFLPLLVFRWLLLALTAVVGGVSVFDGTHPTSGWALAYAALYLLLWTMRLPSLVVQRRGSGLVCFIDIILSLNAVWLAGTAGAMFVPFALGALILPGALWGWPGSFLAAMIFLGCEAVRHWFAPGPSSAWALIYDYLRPVVAASIWPLSVELQKRRPLRQITATTLPRSTLQPATRPLESGADALRGRGSGAGRIPDRPTSATLERRATRLHAAVRQLVADTEQRGLRVETVIEGRDAPLPPGYAALIAKAVEIALDNVRCHAHTDAATLHLAQTPQTIVLTVRDYGVGLWDGTAEPPGFHQLKLLRYRLHELGGTLDISEPPPEGVLFAVMLPLVDDE